MKTTVYKTNGTTKITKIELSDEDLNKLKLEKELTKEEKERLWYIDGQQRCYGL